MRTKPEVRQAAEAAEGSVGRAIGLLDGPALALRQRILELFAQLPDPDPLRAPRTWRGHRRQRSQRRWKPSWIWSTAGCRRGSAQASHGKAQMARVAETWEKVNRAAREAEIYNLERKPLVFTVFGALAEAART